MINESIAKLVKYGENAGLVSGLDKIYATNRILEVMQISDYIYVIDFGSEIARGVPKDVQHNKRVIEAYLGVSEDE